MRRGMLVAALLALLLLPVGAAGAQTGPTEVRFTQGSATREAPQGLVQEIDLYLGGGSYPGCMSAPETPSLNYTSGSLELMDIGMIATCGWQADETVKVTLRDPAGKLQTFTVKAVPAKHVKTVYEAAIYYQPPIDAPEGIYRFTFEGRQGAVKAKLQFHRPNGARLHTLSGDPLKPAFSAAGSRHRLMLSGFLANEPVRLLAYRFEGTRIHFYAYQDYTTDRYGTLIVNVELPEPEAKNAPPVEMNYYAYGRETHTVALERFKADGFSASDPFQMDLYCPGALAPRVSAPANAAAAPSGGGALKIMQVPGFGSRVTVEAPAGTELYLFGQPKCIDHAFWWKVLLRDPVRFGWAAESTPLGKYQLEPVK